MTFNRGFCCIFSVIGFGLLMASPFSGQATSEPSSPSAITVQLKSPAINTPGKRSALIVIQGNEIFQTGSEITLDCEVGNGSILSSNPQARYQFENGGGACQAILDHRDPINGCRTKLAFLDTATIRSGRPVCGVNGFTPYTNGPGDGSGQRASKRRAPGVPLFKSGIQQ